MNPQGQLKRSSTDRMLGGVCGGIANYLGVDSTLVRIGFVVLTLSGVSPFLYLVLWLFMPSDTAAPAPWTQQIQQTVGEIQERATTIASQVSTQVQKVTSSVSQPASSGQPSQGTPSSQGDDHGPSPGPPTRL